MALTGMERRVLRAIIAACGEKTSCLLSPEGLLSHPKAGQKKTKLPETRAGLLRIVRALEADGYFDMVQSRRREEDVWCFTLNKKATGFERAVQQNRRNLIIRICLTVGLAALSFFVGILLKRIF